MQETPVRIRRNLKLCVGASAGGHTTELLNLLEHASWWPRPATAVTTRELLRSQFEQLGPTTVIGECDRHRPWAAVAVVFRAWRFVHYERPEVVVTTGSLPLAILCAFVKAYGGKVVWIDSIAQMENLSMSGNVVRRFADRFFVQWPSLAAPHPNAVYAGELL